MEEADELPCITWEMLSPKIQERAQKLNIYKPWRCCSACKIYHKTTFSVKMCGDCRLVFYCDRKCQRADWPEHKRVCGIQAGFSMIAGFGEPLPDRKTLRRRAHDWMRWIPGVVLLKMFAYAQISGLPPKFDHRKYALEIEFETLNRPGHKIRPVSFQVVRMPTGLSYGKPIRGLDTIMIQCIIDGVDQGRVRNPIIELQDFDQGPCPHWPWVMAMMCVRGESAAHLLRIKLIHFLLVFKDYVKVHPNFEKEFPPPVDLHKGAKWTLSLESFDKWQSIFGKVISY